MSKSKRVRCQKSSVSKTLLPRCPWMPSRDRHKALISRWIFHQPQTCRKEGGTAPPPPFDQRKSTISARLSHVLHHLALSRSDTKIRCQSRSHTISLRPCWQGAEPYDVTGIARRCGRVLPWLLPWRRPPPHFLAK